MARNHVTAITTEEHFARINLNAGSPLVAYIAGRDIKAGKSKSSIPRA
ncbi:hypothetical protein [Arthrobacter sp. CAN_A1]